jgi:hypothetical protein
VKFATKPDLVEGKASTLELLLCRVAGFVKHIFKQTINSKGAISVVVVACLTGQQRLACQDGPWDLQNAEA